MTALAWPDDLRPVRASLMLQASTMVIPGQRNPYFAYTAELPIAGWTATYDFRLSPIRKRRLEGVLGALRGAAGQVLLPEWDYDYDQVTRVLGGGITGTVTATGAKDALSVSLAGVGGTNPVLLAGQRIGFGGWVYRVTADVARSGSSATAPVYPRLRADASGAAVTLSGMTFVMRLVDDRQGQMSIEPSGFAETSLSFVEAL